MESRNYFSFRVANSDDSQWDARGNLLIPGGQSVGNLLRHIFEQLGLISSSLMQRSFYGWEFSAVSSDVAIWVVLQTIGAESWLVIAQERKGFLKRMLKLGRKRAFESVLDGIERTLSVSASISELKRFTRMEYEKIDGGQ
jgi:hypothetical protein